jgi:predicted nucleic acid-binding protein
MSYVDTSIIVAALDGFDPRQKLAQEILEKRKNKIVSELVLAELASIISRRENILFELSEKIKVKKELAIPTLLLYILMRFKLSYRKINGHKRVFMIGNLYLPFATAIDISSKFKLKTLDLFHLAYLKILKKQGEEINEFITADYDFKREKENIERELNISLISFTS